MSIDLWWARLRASHPVWYGDEDSAVLVNLNTGRIVGRCHSDSRGQWDVDLLLPIWTAWRLIGGGSVWFAKFASFPFCWVSMFRLPSREAAEDAVHTHVGMVLLERDNPGDETEPLAAND